jgi:hypothetical protein
VTFRKKYRPEVDHALAEVARINAIKWRNETYAGSDSKAIRLNDRLGEIARPARNGKPAVVFYTAEFAKETKGKRTRPTRSATASQKIYDKMIHPAENRAACYYARFADTIKVDVSKVTPKEDRLLNNQTAPLMVFYKEDGTYASHIDARFINERSFCRSIVRVLPGNTAVISADARAFQNELRHLEALAKKHYVLKAKVKKGSGKQSRSQEQLAARADKLLSEIEETKANLKARSVNATKGASPSYE